MYDWRARIKLYYLCSTKHWFRVITFTTSTIIIDVTLSFLFCFFFFIILLSFISLSLSFRIFCFIAITPITPFALLSVKSAIEKGREEKKKEIKKIINNKINLKTEILKGRTPQKEAKEWVISLSHYRKNRQNFIAPIIIMHVVITFNYTRC